MNEIHEPLEVDFILGDVEPEPDANALTLEFIRKHKQRPEHRADLEEARRTLAAIGIIAPVADCEDLPLTHGVAEKGVKLG